ncbi:MAG: hypothetical protein RL630_757 [Verrucomicrobiota bacterium]|jgi:hypothetical protein
MIRALITLAIVEIAAGLVALPFLGEPGLANPKPASVAGWM